MSSLISADNSFAVWAALLGLTAFGFWCERYAWGRKYTGVMLMMTAAIVLSNVRVLPTASPVYDTVWEYLVPMAIALLLLRADLRRVVRESGPVLIAFLLGSAAVAIGTAVAVAVVPLPENGAELAGIFTGTYIGGSLNFAAVADATGMRESSLLAASVAADNIVTNLHFLLLLALPGMAWLARHFRSVRVATPDSTPAGYEADQHSLDGTNVVGLMMSLTLALVLTAVGTALADWVGYGQYAILVITFLTVLIATLLPQRIKALSGDSAAGTVLIFIFLASIAATADVWQLAQMAPILFVFASVIVSVHLLILFVLGWALRFELPELIMASAVAIGGPASAAALASAKGWKELLIPGVLCGSMGYAIGSFIGVAVTNWLR